MTRQQLGHIIRAAGSITDEKVILVLGSQSILGSVENASGKLLLSMEAHVFPLKAPDKTELINGSIGEISQYHETFGYYAHGIQPDSCPLPLGWEKRLASIQNENTNGIIGLCLGADDLACTKLAAGRPKDLDLVTEMIATGVVNPNRLSKMIRDLPKTEQRLAAQRSLMIVEHRIERRDLARPNEIETPTKNIKLEKDRDGLSL
jgi:uncharacterized nucleotidyltransferase DUF6036